MTERQDSPSLEPNSLSSSQNHTIKSDADSSNTAPESTISEPESPKAITIPPQNSPIVPNKSLISKIKLSQSQLIVIGLIAMGTGLWFNIPWLGLSGAIASFLFSLGIVLTSIKRWIAKFLTPQERKNILAYIAFTAAVAGLLKYFNFYSSISNWLKQFQYDEFGSWADWVGALGQISIAILAVYVAWAQYVISKDLTIQQNRITQQQTIDAYFQGISDLTINDEGLLEDWPQERAIAEGRTAAILSSVDAVGRAKIIRFLSQSKLLTPLRRDNRLGRAILDGSGGYAEDRPYGTRVINLGVMLAGADLSSQDLRWTDLSDANMVRTKLSRSDLVKANLCRTILYEANLSGADLKGAKLHNGLPEIASPRSRTAIPNYETGEYTGVVVERGNFTAVKRLSGEQRYYICAWCGEKSRSTVPGGCEGIPNKLGR